LLALVSHQSPQTPRVPAAEGTQFFIFGPET
jgi:hypothetical protein